jgi:dienelactone hydrolase
LVVLLGVVAWAGLSGGSTVKDPKRPRVSATVGSLGSTTTTKSTEAPTTTTTIPPPSLVASPYFGTFMPTFVDQSSGVSLPTTVYYPTTAGGAPLPGIHPLIVFAEGFLALPTYYTNLLQSWAKAGFVVAAPNFPYTSANSSSPEESDDQYEPGQVVTVIQSMLALAHSPNNVLQGIIDPREIGLAGHSDGGDVMSALAYDSCCTYPGIGATVILSGAELGNVGGTYFGASNPSPLLVVQGLDDPSLNPPAASEQLYQADATGAKYYLSMIHGTHWTPYSLDPTALTAFPTGIPSAQLLQMAQAELPVTEKVTTDFFTSELVPGSGVTSAQIQADGTVPGISTITSANLGGG